MKSVMTKDWQAPSINTQRSSFDRSHGTKMTFDASDLIPMFVDEVVPGDTFKLSTSGFARMATPIYPVMDNIFMDTFYFFVPMRLVWDNAEQFFGEDLVGGDGNAPTKPFRATEDLVGANQGSLEDYMGIPILRPDLEYDELPMRAYYTIWNEWFRDQNLQDKYEVTTGDTPNTGWTDFPPLMKRNKKHDYFTSCLPWPQKSEAVRIPVLDNQMDLADANRQFFQDSTGVALNTGIGATGDITAGPSPGVSRAVYLNPDGVNDNAGTIEQLRVAHAIQSYFEKDARGGTRYPELTRSHFGVTSADARLQRPEYLGGRSNPINITPVASTFEDSTSGRTVGDLGAMGTANFQNNGFVKSFTEHGFIIGLVNVRADVTYQQGLHKMWTRRTRFQHLWPSFAHLGEQAVANREIYAQGRGVSGEPDSQVFGYQERYAEYRYKPSTVHGLFRSYQPDPLDAWHLSQAFTALPLLNSNFIEDATPIERVVATPDEPQFIADFYHQLVTTRPLPIYSTPATLARL